MSGVVVSVEQVSKFYRLGVVGSGTLRADVDRWWAKVRHHPDPLLKVDSRPSKAADDGFIWALRDVSLDIQQGEIIGIIGRNGAGKSTLLKILSRVTAPTAGMVRIRGRLASLLEVGTGFHPELTGRENIFLNSAILGMKLAETRRRFDEIVDFAEIGKYLDTPVKRYSSGMYVRLAFAVAAHLDPDILAVDEVLSVGDVHFQRKCLGKMGSVANEGTTVLFVSHNLGAVRNLCQTGVLIDAGGITARGHIEDVISAYLPKRDAQAETDLESQIRLTRTTDRARFIRSVTRGHDGDKADTFFIGDDLVADITLYCRDRVRSAMISMGVSNSNGIQVYDFEAFQDAGFALEDLCGETTVRVTLRDLKLYPGVYQVHLWMGAPGGEVLDKLENAFAFVVGDGGPRVSRRLTERAILHDVPEWSIVEDA
jgi:lipopolysaccharide transport system ATP-binding protein